MGGRAALSGGFVRQRSRRRLRPALLAAMLAVCGGWWWWLHRNDDQYYQLPQLQAVDSEPATGGAIPEAAVPPAPDEAPQPVRLQATIRRRETLEQIFRREGLSLAALASMRQNAEVRRQLDRLTAGEQLEIVSLEGVPESITRERSLTERLVVRRDGDSYRLDQEAKPVDYLTREAHGTIDSSLFAAGDAAGVSDAVILQLAQIFGWDIDFALDLRRDDEFAVSYQQLYQYGQYVQDGEILAARFVNNGREYRAVRYQPPDGPARYFTPEGRSMERQFLRAPLEFRRVSSRFSSARYHPILNRIRAHKGVDYAASIGTQVYAAGDGHIRRRGLAGGYGNEIEIDHGAGISTVYGHLSRFARGLAMGQRVRQGQLIGYVGMTGLATGPHLHYEYRINGNAVDPQRVRLPDARPIDEALRDDFYRQTAPLLVAFAPASVGPPTREGPTRR